MSRDLVCLRNHIRPAKRKQHSAITLLFSIVFIGYGQPSTSERLFDCSGTVRPASIGAVSVDLIDGSGRTYRAYIDPSGYFRLGAVPEGDYRARIIGGGGNTLDEEYVSVYRVMPMIDIRLPETHPVLPSARTVSMAVLRHHVPSKARKEMDLALRALKNDDTSKAIGHLRSAVAIDPDFMDAHDSLGIRYISIGQHELALAEFEKALKMDPANASVHANIAAAFLAMKQLGDAEKAARESIDLDGVSPKGHFMLALVLIQKGSFTDEVAHQLQLAAEDLPAARLLLGKLYIGMHDYEKGAAELKSYVSTGRKEERAEAMDWLNRFSQSARAGGLDRLNPLLDRWIPAPRISATAVPGTLRSR